MAPRDVYVLEGNDADRLIAVLGGMERRAGRRAMRWELLKIAANTVLVLVAAAMLWSALDRRATALEDSQRALWMRLDVVSGGSPLAD